MRFLPESPVYFDRHTLSIKEGQVSLFTLDGRMRFQLNLAPEDELRLRHGKLREIALTRQADAFSLKFLFADGDDATHDDESESAADSNGELPEYLVVTDNDDLPMPPPASPLTHVSLPS
ncbi:MAG: hypothetical protein HY021_05415 [Burkholderiales bacterium]|nr:hypothetical protein [Burkholderiales bacterium]